MGEVYRIILDGMVARGWAAATRSACASHAPGSPGFCCATRSSDAAHDPHHRRRPRRPVRRGRAHASAAKPSSCTRRPRSPAAAAAPITTSRRHDDRQRQSSAAVGQSRRARLFCARSARRIAWSARRRAEFPFFDLANREQWTLRFNDGPHPVVDFRSAQARARHARARLSAAGAAAVGAARPGGRRGHSLQRDRSTSGWCGRCCWRRSTSIRRRARRRSPGAVIRETLATGGQACRPLIAREGLGATLIEPALALLARAQCARAARPPAARHAVRRRPRRDARFRQGQHHARRRRRRHPGGAALRGGRARPRPRNAERIPRHRQCAFSHRAARSAAADPGRPQRHDRMDVCVPGPHLRPRSAPATA